MHLDLAVDDEVELRADHALLVDHRVLDVVRGLHEPAQVVEDLLAEVREPGVMAPAQPGGPTLRNFH